MIEITTFGKGQSYQSTARNINEALQKNGATVDDIVEIDYRENLIFYKTKETTISEENARC